MNPSVSKLLCAYAYDAGSDRRTCSPPDSAEYTASCVPGCGRYGSSNDDNPTYCNPRVNEIYCNHDNAGWAPDDFENFMMHHEDRLRRFAGKREPLLYSELVFDANTWVSGLPRTVDAIFFMDPAEERITKKVHAQLLHDFGLATNTVPLLRLNLTNSFSPFTRVA
eukprot:7317937-Prymnesium_polylepis.1